MPVTNGGGSTPGGRRIARYRARHGTDPRGPGRPPTHGLRAVERLLRQHGLAVVDGRSTLGRELAHWRQCLVDDLGGDPSTAQTVLIERVAGKRLMVASLETFIVQHPSVFLGQEHGYLLTTYRQLSDSLRADLIALGLERKAKEIDVVAEIAELHRQEEARRQQERRHEGEAVTVSDRGDDGQHGCIKAAERPPGGGDEECDGGRRRRRQIGA